MQNESEPRWADVIDRLRELPDEFVEALEDEGEHLDSVVDVEDAAEMFCAFAKDKLAARDGNADDGDGEVDLPVD